MGLSPGAMMTSLIETLGNVDRLGKVTLPLTPAPDKSFGKSEERVLRGRVHSELFRQNSQPSRADDPVGGSPSFFIPS